MTESDNLNISCWIAKDKEKSQLKQRQECQSFSYYIKIEYFNNIQCMNNMQVFVYLPVWTLELLFSINVKNKLKLDKLEKVG